MLKSTFTGLQRCCYLHSSSCYCLPGGTAAVAPPPFRPGNPALCGSHPLVTPYLCRLGDLLCFVFMCPYCIFGVNCVICVFLQYFDAVGWVFWPVKTVARITYTVLVETLNPAQSINQLIIAFQIREISPNSPKIRTYSSSRSSKVIDLGVNRRAYMQLPISH